MKLRPFPFLMSGFTVQIKRQTVRGRARKLAVKINPQIIRQPDIQGVVVRR